VSRTVSVVVVTYDMARELPRTLRSLRPPYQRDLDDLDYEVVVVDNGSPAPLDPDALADDFDGRLRYERLDDAPPSPARAANRGLALARGDLVGLIVDGARMASPGLVAGSVRAARVAERPIIATLGWHLGPVRHMQAVESGYDQAVEDALLADCDWERDGYELFRVSTLAGSSGRGWFGPLGESSALFLTRSMWDELGGLDEAFALPGGGLVNHDLYRRACELDDTTLVVVLGEGTFHQFHGGAATAGRFSWDEMHDDYQRLRGQPYRPPSRPPLYVGAVPPAALGQLDESVRLALARQAKASRS
jgi:glycosyltransferase involved in cell wall biosynthesis